MLFTVFSLAALCLSETGSRDPSVDTDAEIRDDGVLDVGNSCGGERNGRKVIITRTCTP